MRGQLESYILFGGVISMAGWIFYAIYHILKDLVDDWREKNG